MLVYAPTLHVSYYAQNFAGISGGFSHGSKGFTEPPFCRQLEHQPGLWHCVFSRNISNLILKRIKCECALLLISELTVTIKSRAIAQLTAN